LLESELFGHEKGAFTDAHRRRLGSFEDASGGTLFLDEIGEISLQVQVKLLRVLQERVLRRVGGNEEIPIDVRVVAATNQDLEELVAQGRFREDLFYRLNVIQVHLPPLRRRKDDIPLLARHFLAMYSRELQKPIRDIAPDAMDLMLRHRWPGNVRELENAIERAVTLGSGDEIGVGDLPEEIPLASRTESIQEDVRSGRLDLESAVARFESDLIREALGRMGGNQTRAAELLGITRRLLKLKMDRYGIAASADETYSS
jgi:DNA-binding NtrC family response regulator